MSQPSSPRRSRIAHFKAPFILSVAGSAALSLGCGGKTDADLNRPNPPPSSLAQEDAEDGLPPRLPTTALPCEGEPPSSTSPCGSYSARCVDGEWLLSDNSCNPPPPQSTVCPENPGPTGFTCVGYVPGLTCSYDFCYGATAPMRRCSEATHQWEEIAAPPCNPPPPDDLYCEATLPVPGSDCTAPEVNCSYPGGCEEPSTAVCVSGQWLVTSSSGPACNPPAVVPVCPERELATGEGCAYEGQQCGNEACENDAAAQDGHVCTSGQWQAAVVPCPPGDNAPDAGAADGGS